MNSFACYTASTMNSSILRYQVIFRKEGKHYIADVPTLGISDFGETLEIAKKNVKEAIQLHIEGLVKTKTNVPRPDSDDFFLGVAEISAPPAIRFS